MVPRNKGLSASTEAEQRMEGSGFDNSRSVVTSRSQGSGTNAKTKKKKKQAYSAAEVTVKQ